MVQRFDEWWRQTDESLLEIAMFLYKFVFYQFKNNPK